MAEQFAKRYSLPLTIVIDNGGIQSLEMVKNKRPVYVATHNTNAAATISADLLWSYPYLPMQLDGSHTQLGLWDGGAVYQQHQEFSNTNRIWQRDTPPFLLAHSTHIAGTIGAEGVNPLSRGLANQVTFFAYDFSNDIAEMALAASENLRLSNHSYGTVCGWKYNSDSECWFWYGDISLNSSVDVAFGLYNSTAWHIDHIAHLAPYYLMVKSAGNDRNEGPTVQPVTHYYWNDGWQESAAIRDIDGGPDGYDCLTPKAVAKNNLVIGSVMDLPEGYASADAVTLSAFSSCGPSNDGRIKPDLVCNGESVFSPVNDATDAYETYSGTSMAAASATGAIALLSDLQQQLQPGVPLLSSTIKAILINTADECGPSPGPDYQYGWGLLNAFKAATCLHNNYISGGAIIHEGSIANQQTISYHIHIDDNQNELKVTLCWTDPPGQIEETLPVLCLINDLDLHIEKPTEPNMYLPWVLNPDVPGQAASKGINRLDNVEQVHIQNPVPGDYLITVSGNAIIEGDQQAFSLVINECTANEDLLPPVNLKYRIGDARAQLFWSPPTSLPQSYEVYIDDESIIQSNDTTVILNNLLNDCTYTCYVKAKYQDDSYSLPSNTVSFTPQQAVSTPYYTNFEDGLNKWQIKQELDGWRLGNKDSLTSYYLNLEENTSQFIWIDSGINKWHSHVTDVAASPPINLEDHTNITVNFKYVFVTGIYDVIDELHIVYRQVGDDEWIKAGQPEASSKWMQASFTLPDEAAGPNTQIGFYYNDFYQHGMGAAIDEIYISSFVPTLIHKQVTKANISLNGNTLSVSIDNSQDNPCSWQLLDMTGRCLHQGIFHLSEGVASTILPPLDTGIYIVRLSSKHTNITCKVFNASLAR
ncbi:S8 family serine peptidase [Carboxylicivirga mesophila]|uniref:S8 family serine peptidase n=1 Tax=Carboxylicivirga mesophila TaxID=1166478 RepID=A0ABS5KFF2_9BACT|nr:S8 family serine peptidase [Carboxylicivirga mesophila]MBS2213794.1 S8 family serine peptidase [Carboxylicivirga mesophila]